jgi:two-component system, NtrC family, sensor kinase
MLGYEEVEIKDSFEEWEGRLHPDERDRVITTMRNHLAGSLSEYEIEHRLRHKNGSYRWVLSRGISLRDANGKPTRFGSGGAAHYHQDGRLSQIPDDGRSWTQE